MSSLKRVLLFGLFLIISASYNEAHAGPHDSWKKGNAFYQQKQYDSAAYYFEQLAAAKPADATLFYNLGNTYYRLNKVGPAILNYERALRRKPDYKEAKDNLLLAQSRIPGGLKQPPSDIFFLRWWKAIASPGLMMLWAILSLIFFISLIGLMLYRRLNKGRVYIRPQYIGGLILLWLSSLLIAFSAAYAALSNIHAVVVAGSGASFIENKKGTMLPEGTTVKITAVKGAQYEVELTDSRTGLMQKSELALVD